MSEMISTATETRLRARTVAVEAASRMCPSGSTAEEMLALAQQIEAWCMRPHRETFER